MEAKPLFLRDTVKTSDSQILQIHNTVRTSCLLYLLHFSFLRTCKNLYTNLHIVYIVICIYTHILNLPYAAFNSTENKENTALLTLD